MNWWQRLVFSIISLVAGWFSFDYLLMTSHYIGMITENPGKEHAVWFLLLGIVMLAAFFLVLAVYLSVIRKITGNLNIVEYGKETSKKERKKKIRSKWFDLILQGGILATGFFLRFFFILVFYLPGITNI